MLSVYKKLEILADSAKYDVSCSTSGVGRKNNGKIGNASASGICHSWSADGRCISLLKVLMSNKCVYDCEYCINKRTQADTPRASFEPRELADLTIEFYRRNYIEGLFISSAVEMSPDHTVERMMECLHILRREYGFAGYVHAKIIPGASSELVHAIGLLADRVSVNVEMPSEESLSLLAPQKKKLEIFRPMKQITNTLIERKSLVGPGNMFKGIDINTSGQYLNEGFGEDGEGFSRKTAGSLMEVRQSHEVFAPAGQTTQMIIGATGESDRQIIKTSENIYRIFKMKRVYYSAYVPVVQSPVLPADMVLPPLAREHRLYQADWLLRFYHFSADELLDDENPNLDEDVDPKVTWALRHLDFFPMEINRASFEELLRIPGVGTLSALRIVRQRKYHSISLDDLKKIGVVMKRAKYFLTCCGQYGATVPWDPQCIRDRIAGVDNGVQLSMFAQGVYQGGGKVGLPL